MRARGPAPGAPKGAPGAGAGPGIGEGANTVKEGGAWTAWNGAVLLGAGLAASAVACYALDERLQDEVGGVCSVKIKKKNKRSSSLKIR